MDDPLPEIRVGDRERQAVDARLRQAHADGVLTLTEYDERAALCWAARTRADLEQLTRDLPPPEPARTPVVSAAPSPSPARPRTGMVQRAVGGVAAAALIGTVLFQGGQVLTANDGTSIFGSRELQVSGTQDQVEVGMLFGRLTVRVPDDVRVRTAGTVIFGDLDCAAACQGGPTTQREVLVDATGAFGKVEVLRLNEQPSDNDRDRDNDRDDEDD